MKSRPTPEHLRAFEQRIVAHFAAGALPFLIHLSGGNEEWLCDIFNGWNIRPEDWVLSTHRNHHHALLKGIPAADLEKMILEGRSMFVFSEEHRFITSSILAGTCAIACGLALAEQRKQTNARVFCFIGDGAEDNGHFWEAVRYANSKCLPLFFLIEDNDRQVDTSFQERWSDWRRPQYPKNVVRHCYHPAFPHGGAGLPPGSVKFDPAKVAAYVQRLQ
jgi:TPP-dependent pyruvate/acetoin dehydrogenase alpha subunit